MKRTLQTVSPSSDGEQLNTWELFISAVSHAAMSRTGFTKGSGTAPASTSAGGCVGAALGSAEAAAVGGGPTRDPQRN